MCNPLPLSRPTFQPPKLVHQGSGQRDVIPKFARVIRRRRSVQAGEPKTAWTNAQTALPKTAIDEQQDGRELVETVRHPAATRVEGVSSPSRPARPPPYLFYMTRSCAVTDDGTGLSRSSPASVSHEMVESLQSSPEVRGVWFSSPVLPPTSPRLCARYPNTNPRATDRPTRPAPSWPSSRCRPA